MLRVDRLRLRTWPLPPPAALQAALAPSVSQVPLGAIPNYGGKTSEGTNATHHRWGTDRVPTPREIVGHLDQYVVGQVGSKGAGVWREVWGGWAQAAHERCAASPGWGSVCTGGWASR